MKPSHCVPTPATVLGTWGGGGLAPLLQHLTWVPAGSLRPTESLESWSRHPPPFRPLLACSYPLSCTPAPLLSVCTWKSRYCFLG